MPKVQRGAFPLRKAWEGDPKALPWGLGHTSSHKLGHTFTLSILQNFLQRFNLQHTAPGSQVAALAGHFSQVLTSSPSYKEPGHHTPPWTPQRGTFEVETQRALSRMLTAGPRSRGDSCCSEEPGSGICSTDYLERRAQDVLRVTAGAGDLCPPPRTLNLRIGVGRQGERERRVQSKEPRGGQGSPGQGVPTSSFSWEASSTAGRCPRARGWSSGVLLG